MPRSYTTALCIISLFFLLLPGLQASGQVTEAEKMFIGNWEGALEIPGGGPQLRLRFTIREDSANGMVATMASLDQGAMDIPVDSVIVDGTRIRLTLPQIGGSFEAELAMMNLQLQGEWEQMGMSLPLTMLRAEEPEAPNRPQTPEPPFPYRAEEVTIENTGAGVTLAATLTMPSSGRAPAAVVLVSGSGPQDRDSEIAHHRPFLVLADYLTRHGIAVLRYDDRGFGESTGSSSDATTEDFAGDTHAAVSFLASNAELADARIGVVGHSEGGIIAPMVAAQSKDVDFIVLMGAPGLPGEQILIKQQEGVMKSSMEMVTQAMQEQGMDDEQIQSMLDAQLEQSRKMMEDLHSVIKSPADSTEAAAKLRDILREVMGGAPSRDEMIDAQIASMLTRWTRFFVSYDPRPALTKVTIPVLAIGGEKDTQVFSADNLPVIEEALREAGNQDVTVSELKGLNHLFQTADTGAITEYATIEETFAPSALELIGQWILDRTGSE